MFGFGNKYRKFITQSGRIEFLYPKHWKDIIEEGGTYLFYDENLGSLRVTLLIVSGKNFQVSDYLLDTYNSKKELNPEWRKFNERDFVSYEESSTNDNTYIHYYTSGDVDTILICSYAYHTSLINNPKIKSELIEVEKTLASIIFK